MSMEDTFLQVSERQLRVYNFDQITKLEVENTLSLRF